MRTQMKLNLYFTALILLVNFPVQAAPTPILFCQSANQVVKVTVYSQIISSPELGRPPIPLYPVTIAGDLGTAALQIRSAPTRLGGAKGIPSASFCLIRRT